MSVAVAAVHRTTLQLHSVAVQPEHTVLMHRNQCTQLGEPGYNSARNTNSSTNHINYLQPSKTSNTLVITMGLFLVKGVTNLVHQPVFVRHCTCQRAAVNTRLHLQFRIQNRHSCADNANHHLYNIQQVIINSYIRLSKQIMSKKKTTSNINL